MYLQIPDMYTQITSVSMGRRPTPSSLAAKTDILEGVVKMTKYKAIILPVNRHSYRKSIIR